MLARTRSHRSTSGYWPKLPKPLIFAPCEKVIVDRESSNISLITVLSNIHLRLPPSDESEKQSAIKIIGAMKWDIVVLWIQEPGDAGRKFEQQCELLGPDGSVLNKNRTEFVVNKRTHRVITHVHGFPLSRAGGEHLLKLYLRAEGDTERRVMAEYPIAVQISFEKDK